MDYRFFGHNILKTCASCDHGQHSSNKSQVLCKKKGVISIYESCKYYRYNPLRRSPVRQADVNNFLKNRYRIEDFEL